MISFVTTNDHFQRINLGASCAMKSVLLCFLLAIISNTFAQQSVALFAAKDDSIAYVQVQENIQHILQNRPGDNTSFDSLLKVQAALRSKIIGYKVVYNSNKTFTPLEDIAKRKVSPLLVSRLSISGEDVNRLSSTVFQCKNLTELELVNTTLRRLPSKLSKLQKLKTIYVFNNSPTGKFKLGKNKTVRELIFRGVEAKKLPDSYKKILIA